MTKVVDISNPNLQLYIYNLSRQRLIIVELYGIRET